MFDDRRSKLCSAASFSNQHDHSRLQQADDLSAEIGVGLTGFGCLFTVLGIFFLFDRGLLAMGNVSCCLLRRRQSLTLH